MICHPVAGFGRAAGALERRLYAPHRRAGAAFTTVAVGVPVLAGAVAAALTKRQPLARTLLVAAATWGVLGGRTLRREARIMARHLDGGDLPSARGRLSHLCGRDASALDALELARATVESVAENTSDAVVGPLVWGGLAGLPGLLGYRAANTLDAMVGHRCPRYERFGWAAAHLDDLLTWPAARIGAALAVALARLAGGRRHDAWRVLRDDGAAHPSPNAGRLEAAFAGALGVRLGGRNAYDGRVEQRPQLGDGRVPGPADVAGAVRLSALVGGAAALCAAAVGDTVAS